MSPSWIFASRGGNVKSRTEPSWPFWETSWKRAGFYITRYTYLCGCLISQKSFWNKKQSLVDKSISVYKGVALHPPDAKPTWKKAFYFIKRQRYGNQIRIVCFNRGSSCRWYKMVAMKIGKQLLYNFYMKFMMWLDYARWKYPFPGLQKGGKWRGKLFPPFSPFPQPGNGDFSPCIV